MFCDACGDEIDRNFVSNRLDVIHYINCKPFRAIVYCGKGTTVNEGHLCKKCLLEIITIGTDPDFNSKNTHSHT